MAEPIENDDSDILTVYFTLQDSKTGIVTCNLCDDFSCESDEAGQLEHLKTKHGYQEYLAEDSVSCHDDDEVEEEEEITIQELDEGIDDRRKRRKSSVWLFFDKEDECKATCRFCRKRLSYRTSATNLTKHLLSQHSVEAVCDGKQMSLDVKDDNQITVAVLSEGSLHRNRSILWKYYKSYDPVERLATCLLCGANRSYKTSITNLRKHLERKHSDIDMEDVMRDVETKKEIQQESDTEVEENDTLSHLEVGQEKKSSSFVRRTGPAHSSILWLYYTRIDERAKIAECKLCNARLSYMSTTTNLKKHLKRSHSDVPIPTREDGRKRMLLSTKGELFEIDDQNKQADSIHSNIFIDDFDADSDQEAQPTPKKSKRKKVAENITVTDNVTDSSSDDGFPFARKESDSLDRFGKYLVALLRQLPKNVSNRLQADFIGQIMKAQVDDV